MFRTLALLIPLSLYGMSAIAMAEMYKWQDQQGRIHYSEAPPPENTKSLKIDAAVNSFTSEVPDIDFYQAEVKSKEVAMPKLAKNEVWLFSTPTCGYCRHAKEYMRLKKISYKEMDITQNAQYNSWFKQLGGGGVPLTLIGQNPQPITVRGFSDQRFDEVFAQR